MTIEYIKRFITTAEYLNFSKAADVLSVSQPALSYSISMLEKKIGIPLFQRDTTSVKLTPAGERFLPTAVKIIDLYDQAVDRIGRENNSV